MKIPALRTGIFRFKTHWILETQLFVRPWKYRFICCRDKVVLGENYLQFPFLWFVRFEPLAEHEWPTAEMVLVKLDPVTDR